MRDTLRSEFAYQLFALLFAALFVHAIYVTAIRPEAETLLAEQRAAAAVDENYVPERNLAVVLRDFEQEACFILMLWAMAIMGYKARSGLRERALLEQKLLPVTPGMSVYHRFRFDDGFNVVVVVVVVVKRSNAGEKRRSVDAFFPSI